MATWAIGDVQGCFDELRELLARVRFERGRDTLWFVGDLVNRGPKSLEVLRFVRDLGDGARVVLGNHDLHLVCRAEGLWKRRDDDTLDAVLEASDGVELVAWLRSRPLMHVEGRHAMVHAGLLPGWSIARARLLAGEVESALAAKRYADFLAQMYGSEPARWHDGLAGWDRLRAIVNVMTRMRFSTPENDIEVRTKGAAPPAGFRPWFDFRTDPGEPDVVCGHWSTLGLKVTERVMAIDSGCVWGGALTAVRLEDREIVQVPCAGYRSPGDSE
ncbi:MAG: symmetrical bis(5'-nucleosyl)-tetraphosphatase [Betaproteobacteria bacterium]|nr:symmetrical bis(5'-nucleosyl)-tetraphosphatase [Betaproteobacteria bacterium]